MRRQHIFVTILVLAVIIPFASANIFTDTWGKITGKATNQPVDLSINIGSGGAPSITTFATAITDVSGGLNEGPLSTTVTVKFEATDSEGYGNLNDSSATATYSKSGETSRSVQCTRIGGESSGNVANYSCPVEMWWWDGPGVWSITTFIKDVNNNQDTDATKMFSVGSTTGFVSAPSSLTWNVVNPGATNQEANQHMTLNNTGNLVRNVEINATNLLGVTDNTKGLYATNFTAHIAAGCEGTAMRNKLFTQVVGASVPIGNYSLADGTGQEDIYFCLEGANPDLTQQSYSTAEEGAWTLKIVA